MAGRGAWWYFLPGGIVLLLVAWLLYARAAPPPATPRAIATAPSDDVSDSDSDAPGPDGVRAVAGAGLKSHVVVAPSAPEADGAADGAPSAARALEGFASVVDEMTEGPGAPRGDFRPCEVYFTDNVKICDAGGYDRHIAYHEEKLRKVQAAVRARGGAPTPEQNDLILKYTRILDDYKKLPEQQYCKLSLPNWQQRTADKQPPILSRSERNKDRGPVEHWAYCWRENATTTPAGLERTGMLIDRVAGKPTGAVFNGVFYVRGKFDESISPSGAVKTYCHESSGAVREYPMETAIVFQNALKGPRRPVYHRRRQAVPVREWDSDTFFRNRFLTEQVSQPSRDHEVVTAKPSTRNVRLVKRARDPCGRVVEHYSTLARARFTEGIQLSSTRLGANDDYLRGTTDTLVARIRSHESTLAARRAQLAQREQHLVGLWRNLAHEVLWHRVWTIVRAIRFSQWNACVKTKCRFSRHPDCR